MICPDCKAKVIRDFPSLGGFAKFGPLDGVSELTSRAETQYSLYAVMRVIGTVAAQIVGRSFTRGEERYVNPSVEIIRQAILERRRLEFGYRSLPRVVVPMAVGIGQYGRWQLRAHQIGGRSSSGGVGDGTPKLFEVADMIALAILAQSFEIPPFYARGDRAFRRIDTEL